MKYLTVGSFVVWLCAGFWSVSIQAAQTTQAESKELNEITILGWIEWVYLQPSQLKAKAKLDTGAKTSSIHAKNIEYFEKDGEDWVRFQFSSNTRLKSHLYEPGKSKKVITIEAPLVRRVLIKQHKRKSAERPVVFLPFTLAGQSYQAEFTLTDRSKFIYPVLLGRRFLKEVALVDPANTFLKTHSKLKLNAENQQEQTETAK
ncbi:MAG: ATP-dependent zinc protease [Pseudomonadales bacterium]|nr:ATP-dependent zinc protease [Pseudomonadales bacterium]